MQCRPAKTTPEHDAVAEDGHDAQSGSATASPESSATTSSDGGRGPARPLSQAYMEGLSSLRSLEASPDCEDRVESRARSDLGRLNLALHLKIQEKDIPLTTSQLEFDAPNLITRALEGNPTFRDDIEMRLTTSGIHLRLLQGDRRRGNRSPAIFESLLRPYLSGSVILPLSNKALSVLLPCCQQDEDPLAVLYGEAEFWGFTKLEECILQEKNKSLSGDQTEPLQAGQPGLQPGLRESEEMEEKYENPLALFQLPNEQLTAFQRDRLRQYRASNEKVIAWLLALRGSNLAKPSNSTYLATFGWQPGTMFYNTGPAVHRSSIDSEALVQPAGDADYVRKVDFVIKSGLRYGNLSINRQSAFTLSTGDFHLLAAQVTEGGAFHTCMQNKYGRHGLRILYQEGCKPSSAPAFLAGILLVGYYCRGSIEITSHPSALMKRVLPENRWTASLASALRDDEFIDSETDIQIAFRLADPTVFWYLPY